MFYRQTCFTVKKNVKRPGRPRAAALLHQRGHDQPPVRLLALAIGLDVVP